jgi:effector-binding domain-containing protein
MAHETCRLAKNDAVLVAAIRFRGEAGRVGKSFDHLLQWAQVNHVEQWGPLVGTYLDPAAAGAEVEGEAWLPIPPELRGMDTADAQVVVKEIAPHTVARCTHRGFPDGLGAGVARLLDWVRDCGLERAAPLHRQVYRAAPKGEPGAWVVDIEIPVVCGERE